MNREQFLRELEMELSGLSNDEIRDALKFYEDYFNDAGLDNEQAVIHKLGSPKAVAAEIVDGLGGNNIFRRFKTMFQGNLNGKMIASVLLIIFLTPLALAASGFVLGAVTLTLGFILLGALGIMGGLGSLLIYPPFGIVMVGLASVILGIGLLLLSLAVFIAKKAYNFYKLKTSVKGGLFE